MRHKIIMGYLAAGWLMLAALQDAAANGISVTNITLCNYAGAASNVYVSFDLSWSNSWRMTDNWDAAWVFVKFKPNGSNEWFHATLSTNSADHKPAANSAIAAVPDGKGVFVYSSSYNTGGVNYARTRLLWNYGADGYNFIKGTLVNIAVQAIEMVYIPAGAFYLGSGGGEVSPFYEYPTTSTPYLVSSTNAITVGTSAGNLYYANSTYCGDQSGPISNSFPNGYAAFYCMKYEISQGQYASFLNYLTAQQAASLYPSNSDSYRHTITNIAGVYLASAPDRACNYLSWMDGCAYADWAGLRPMTELEFEKACRGAAYPVVNEYAWGSTAVTQQTGTAGTDGSGTETASPASANCNCSSGISGPVRCGIYAVANAGREKAGSGYWGIMELSGNLWERPVTVGNVQGRMFRGTHGDGVLSTNGWADNSDWPGYSAGQVTGASGTGFRGGFCSDDTTLLRISDRPYAAYADSNRRYDCGFRGARTAP